MKVISKERKQELLEKMKKAESIYRQCVAGNYTKDRISEGFKYLGADHQMTSDLFLSPISGAWNKVDRLKAIFLAPFVKDANVLLIGSYGTGKTYLCETLSKILGMDFVNLQGEVDAYKSAFCGVVDIAPENSTLVIDEIYRYVSDEMNFLTALLAERKMEVEVKNRERISQLSPELKIDPKGLMRSVDGLTVFATRSKKDDLIPPYILDRFHISLATDTDPVGITEAREAAAVLLKKEWLSPEEIKDLRSLSDEITVSPDVHTFIEAAFLQFSSGHCGLVENDFIPSDRSKPQVLEFAKVNALSEGRNTVDLEKDVKPYLFLNIVHKIRIKPDAINIIMNDPTLKALAPDSLNTLKTLPIHDIVYILTEKACMEANKNNLKH